METVDSLRAKYPKLFSKALNIPLDEEIIASNPVIRALKAILDGTLNTSVPHEGIKPYVANPMPLRELLKGLSS